MKNRRGIRLVSKLLIFLICFLISENSFAQIRTEAEAPFNLFQGNQYDPAFSNDGSQLAFITDNSGQYKIFISYKQNDQWSEPEEITGINNFNNGRGNIRYPSFNYDGSILYFSADFNLDSSNVDIYYSEKMDGNWTAPKSLGEPVNTLFYDGQPSISADNKSLYFVRNSKSAMFPDADCKKVFVSNRNFDGSWSKPEELPVPINVECEQTPKISIDNKTLYYSSMREGGKGGFDIYKTKLIAKNVWVPAESLDTLNSPDNEFAPTLFFNNNLAYFQVAKTEKRNTISKIYKIDLAPQFLPENNIQFSGKVKDLTSGKPISADISIYDPFTSRLDLKFCTDASTGDYQYYLPVENNYLIDYNKTGYSHFFVNTGSTSENKNEQRNQDILLYKDISLILNVYDNEIFRPIDANIEIRNSKNEVVNLKSVSEKGRFKFDIPIGDKYLFSVSADYFEPKNFEFDLTGIVQFDEFERDEELESKKVDFQIDISDEESLAGIPVDVVITNLDNNEVVHTKATASNDGKYVVKLREGDRYNVSISTKGYSYYNTTVDLKKKEAPKKLEVKLKQLKEDTKLTLNNIRFEVNSADLEQSSFEELDRVVKLMSDNPSMKIEISAHTDNVGSDAYNLRLSKRRAKSVLDYLIDKKVDTERLISQGYGKTKPLVPNDSEENKAINRRVELKIIKIE